jgi:FkbM family methyltransferase
MAGIPWNYARRVGVGRYVWRMATRQFAKRVLKRNLDMALPNGLTLVLPRQSPFASEVWVCGPRVDFGAEDVFVAHLEPDAVLLDVGAHFGYYAMLAAKSVARVFAFEPDPRTQPLLRLNADRVANIEVCPLAVASAPGKARFALVGESPKSHLLREGDAMPERTVEVDVVTLDAFIEEKGRPRVGGIKIDVEGFDLEVLRGAGDIIERDQPLILTEFNTGDGTTNEASGLVAFAAERGYAIYASGVKLDPPEGIEQGRLFHWSPTLHESVHFNMIFLVPERLQADFRSAADQASTVV